VVERDTCRGVDVARPYDDETVYEANGRPMTPTLVDLKAKDSVDDGRKLKPVTANKAVDKIIMCSILFLLM
jgi:hypothetical protein